MAADRSIGAAQLELQVEEKSFPREFLRGKRTTRCTSSRSVQWYKVPKSVTFRPPAMRAYQIRKVTVTVNNVIHTYLYALTRK